MRADDGVQGDDVGHHMQLVHVLADFEGMLPLPSFLASSDSSTESVHVRLNFSFWHLCQQLACIVPPVMLRIEGNQLGVVSNVGTSDLRAMFAPI